MSWKGILGSRMDPATQAWIKHLATGVERVLAMVLLIGVIVFAFASISSLGDMDWRLSETFYELIYRILILVIGLELVRTLLTHDLSTVLELLAFVIARKLLKPDLETIDVVFGVTAFVALLAARRYFVKTPSAPLRS